MFCNRNSRRFALAIPFFLLFSLSYAGPEGGQVVGGLGDISRSGNTTTINQATENMAINWDSYNVDIDEIVRYHQPGQNSVSLNRILSNSGSQIHGRIIADGHVILVNPNGLIFTETAVVNAGGVMASGLNLDTEDFMNGNFAFKALEGTEGVVINAGLINAASGGNVALIGQRVENQGLITAELGSVVLAAGKEAVVTFDNDGLLGVQITEAVLQNEIGLDAAVINSGDITAENGQILLSASVSRDIFSGAVNTGAMQNARSAVVDKDGSFTLGAGADVDSTGVLDVSGDQPGEIVILGENVTHEGQALANGQWSEGGQIEIHSRETTLVAGEGIVEADADAGVGGRVHLLGRNVGLVDRASVTADGFAGGGDVLIGGDQTGSNPLVPNAEFIFLGEDTLVSADATDQGDGGRLIAFAENTARLFGGLSSRGGAISGDGGFVETSGLRDFDIRTTPDVGAEMGIGGSWLIDPLNITINVDLDDNDRVSDGPIFTASGGSGILSVDRLIDALNSSATVIISTEGDTDPASGDAGNIDFAVDLNNASGSGVSAGTLILNASNDISMGGFGITGSNTNGMNLVMNAERNILMSDSTITTNGGYVALNGNNIGGTAATNGFTGTIDTSGGNFYVGVATETNGAVTFDTDGNSTSSPISGDFFMGASAALNVRSDIGGGDIFINALGDVTLSELFLGERTNDPVSARVSTVFAQGDNITLNDTVNYARGQSEETANTINFTLSAANDITLEGVDLDEGANADRLNLTLNADADNDGAGGGDVIIRGSTLIGIGGGNVVVNGDNFLVDQAGVAGTPTIDTEGGLIVIGGTIDGSGNVGPTPLSGRFDLGFQNITSGSNSTASLDSGGGDVHIYTAGATNIYDPFSTGGGELFAGTASSRSGSFNSFFATGTGVDEEFSQIATNGGNINIFTSGAVSLGGLSTGSDLESGTTDIGAVTVNANGNVELRGTYRYFSDLAGATAEFAVSSNTGGIFLERFSLDNGDDTGVLNVVLNSSGSIDDGSGNLYGVRMLAGSGNFYTTGGNFSSTSVADFLLEGEVFTQGGNVNITTSGAASSLTVGSIDTSSFIQGDPDALGSVSLSASGQVVLGNILTRTGVACGSANNLQCGDLFVSSDGDVIDADSTLIDIGGSSNFNSISGVSPSLLNINLDNAGHDFGSAINIGSLVNDLALGNVQIDTNGADVFISALGNISRAATDTTDFDEISLPGTALDIEAASVELYDISTRGGTNQAGGNLEIRATAGGITTGQLDASGGTAVAPGGTGENNGQNGLNAGTITVTSESDISIASVDASGSDSDDGNENGNLLFDGGQGAAVAITSNTASITVGQVNVDGGNGEAVVGGTCDGGINCADNDDANGGDAGSISLSANGGLSSITLSGDLTARGGHLTDGVNPANGVENGRGGLINLTGNLILSSSVEIDATLAPNDLGSIGFGPVRPANVAVNGTIDGTAGTETLTINAARVDLEGNIGAVTRTGGITINASDQVDATGVDITAASLSVTASNFIASDIDTSGAVDDSGGSISLNVGAGDISVGSLDASGGLAVAGVGQSGGAIALNAAALTVGAINTAGSDGADILVNNGGAAGAVSITATDDDGTPSISINGDINTEGGAGAVSGGAQTANLVLDGSGSTAASVTFSHDGPITSDVTVTNNNATGNDTFFGPTLLSGQVNWDLGGDGNGSFTVGENSGTVSFTNFNVIEGGAGDDYFTVSSAFTCSGPGGGIPSDACVSGNAGNDTFDINAAVTGEIVGDDGDDIFYLGALVSDGNNTDGDRDVRGNQGNDTFYLEDISLFQTIAAGDGQESVRSASDTRSGDLLVLDDESGPANWNLTSDQNGSVGNVDFTVFENIEGANTRADTFVFSFSVDGVIGQYSGDIDARGGEDVVDLTFAGADIQVTLGSNINGVANAETVRGSGGTLTVLNALSQTFWTISNTPIGSDGTNDGAISNAEGAISFLDFANLVGSGQSDVFAIEATGSLTGTVNGGSGGGNSLAYAADGLTWNLDSTTAFSGDVNGRAFSNIQSLTGNGASDILVGGNRSNTWLVVGNTGNGLVTSGSGQINYDGMEVLRGNDSADRFEIQSAGVATDIQGGGSSDTLVGRDEASTWSIDGANSGSVGLTAGASYVTNFSGIENLIGGNAANDEFVFTDTGSIGSVDGGTSSGDIANFSDIGLDISVSVGGTSNGLTRINTVVGNNDGSGVSTDATLTLVSASVNTDAWFIGDIDGTAALADGINDGQVAGLSFVNFNNLTGGDGDDTFTLDAAGISGITGLINGGNGADTVISRNTATTWAIVDNGNNSLSYANGRPAVGDPPAAPMTTTEFVAIENLSGTGIDTLILPATPQNITLGQASVGGLGLVNFESINASSTVQNSLTAPNDAAVLWSITGANSGTVTLGSDPAINFSNFQTLVGAQTQGDTFTFGPSGSITTLINGRDGTDVINGRNAMSTWTFAVDGNSATGIAAFENIDVINGNSLADEFAFASGASYVGTLNGGGGVNTLSVQNGLNTWALNSSNAGTLNAVTDFNNISIFMGGSNVDTFAINFAAGLTSTINAGGGDDRLDLSGIAAPSSLRLDGAGLLENISNVEVLVGNNTSSELIGDNTLSNWLITGANNGEVSSGVFVDLAFEGFANLTGSDAVDEFVFERNGSISGAVVAGDGVDVIDIVNLSALDTVDITIGANFGGVAGAERVIGNNSQSMLTAENATNAWSITGENDGTVAGIEFFDFNQLVGGSGEDTFTFSASGSVTGYIDGGAEPMGGADVVDLSLAPGIEIRIGDNFRNIESFIGGGGTFRGDNVTNNWIITGPNSGTLNGLAFSGYNSLLGGDADDTFTFNNGITFSGSINAGSQANFDTVDLSLQTGAVSETIGGNIRGVSNAERVIGNGSNSTLSAVSGGNTWTISGANDGNVVGGITFEDFANLTGGNGADVFNFTPAGALDGLINGGGSNDTVNFASAADVTLGTDVVNVENLNSSGGTLRAADVANTWLVNDVNAGSVNSVNFSGFRNLFGGNADDFFEITSAGSVEGAIDALGQLDRDTVDLSDQSLVEIFLGSSTAGGVANVERIIGNGTNSTITGRNDTNNTWTIDQANGGTVVADSSSANIAFEDFANLVGGNFDDNFIFSGAGAIAGRIDGGADLTQDTVNYSALSSPVAVTIGDDVINLESLIGSDGSSLTGPAGDNSWQITGGDSGAVNTSIFFTNFATLIGGASTDIFTINGGSISGAIRGGGGTDTLTADNTLNTWAITGANAGSVTGVNSFSDMDILNGGSFADTVAVNANFAGTLNTLGDVDVVTLNAEITSVNTGAGDDQISINQSGLNNTAINGGGDIDILQITHAAATSWDIDGTNTVGNVGFSNIEIAVGNGNVDTVALSADFGELRLGGGNDNLSIDLDGVTAFVDAGTGENDAISIGHDAPSAWIIDSVSSVDNVSFSGFEIARGNNRNETVQVNARINTIETFGGADTVTLSADVGTLNTGNGSDIITVASPTITADIIAGDNGNNDDEIIGPPRTSTDANNWIIVGQSGTLNSSITFAGAEQISGNVGRDNFLVTGEGVGTLRGIANGLGVDTAQNYLQLDDAVRSGTELLWEITRDNGGNVQSVISQYFAIENLTGRNTGLENFRFTGEFIQTGLIDGGDAISGIDNVRDTISVEEFRNGVVVEIGPNAAAVSDDAVDKPVSVVNVYNIESIAGRSGSDDFEADNWIAITHDNGVEWFYTPNTNLPNCVTGLNQGCIFELDTDGMRIANSGVEVFNFGSLLGGSGDESPIDVIDSGPDRTITGQYIEGTGLRNPLFSGSGFYVVDIDDRLGSVRARNDAVVLLRVTDDTPFYLASNEWLIRDGETAIGTFSTSADADFSFTFSGVTQFQGGEGNDTFTIDAAGPLLRGAINGGGGAGVDAVNVSATTPALTFGLSRPVDTPQIPNGTYPSSGLADAFPLVRRGLDDVVEIAGIETLNASSVSDITLLGGLTGNFNWNIGETIADGSSTLVVDRVVSAAGENLRFSGVDTVVGDEGNDSFTLYALDRVANAIDGGAGEDQLDLTNISVTLAISVDPALTENIDLQIANLETLTTTVNDNTLFGGGASNRFTLSSVNDGSLVYNNGSGDASIDFSNITHFVGGSGADEFVIADVLDDDGNVSAWGTITGWGLNDRIQVTANADLVFQVSALESGRAVNTDDGAINIAGIETLDANATQTNTLAARADSANNWIIAATNSLETLADASLLTFSGIQNITGGDLQDQFNFDAATINGLIDGGASSAAALDTLFIRNLDNLSVQLGSVVNGNINLSGVEALTAEGANHTLIGADTGNIWNINGGSASQITSSASAATISFTGFENLTGGNLGDVFVFSADVSLADYSRIDGGVGDINVRDQVDISNIATPSIVSLDETYDGADLYIARIESIAANLAANDAAPRNTLVSAAGNNAWTISNINSGTVNTAEFVGFASLIGRGGDDVFTFEDNGQVSGFIDGGAHINGDQVDLSELAEVRVQVGDIDEGFLNIEQYRGNNRNSTLSADDTVNIWTLNSGTNQGLISDIAGNPVLEFIGFNILEGGDARDSFVLNGGAVDGEIRAGLGDDELIVTVVPGTSGELIFVGGQGRDQIDIAGGSADTITTYGFDADGNAGLEYTTTGVAGSYELNYTEVEEVDDEAQSNLLIIGNRLGVADTFLIENNAFTSEGYAQVSYGNKASVRVRGEAMDIVNIAGQIAVDNTLEFVNAQVNAVGNDAEVEAVNLILNGTAQVGSAESRLATNIDNLSLSSAAGAVYIAEENALNFAVSSNSTALIDILVDDDITSTGAIAASGDLVLRSVNGDINLSNANNIAGLVSLASSGDITFNNAAATRLGDITAQNFALNAGGNVTASGILSIAGTSTLDSGDDDIVFANNANDFSAVNVINAGSVTLVDANTVNVQGNAAQLFSVTASNAINVVDSITANDIQLIAGEGLAIDNDLNAINSIAATANAIAINGDLRVSNNILGDAVMLDAGAGLIDIVSGGINTNNAANDAGDVAIRAGEFSQQRNADIDVGALSIVVAGDVNQRAAVNAQDNINITSTNGSFVMGDLARLSGFDITVDASNDVSLRDIAANNVRVTGNTVTQQGAVTGQGSVVFNAAANLEQNALGTVVAGGDVSVAGATVSLAGSTQAANSAVTIESNVGPLIVSGNIEANTISLSSAADIAMDSSGVLSGVESVSIIAQGNLGLAEVSASSFETGLVSLTSINGGIGDNNGDATNVTSNAVILEANNGIGSGGNPLDLGVSLLNASNNSGLVSLVNDRELGINVLANNGDITLVNQQGNVTLLNDGDPAFNIAATTAQEQHGVTNANIDAGNVFILVSNGDALASGVFSANEPDIAGESIIVSTPRGTIGQFGRPLVLYYRNEATFVGLVSYNPRLAYGSPSEGFINNSDLTLDFSALSQASGDLVIEVESLEEVDPAVFTDVRNYSYDNISILMPRDQRYEDEFDDEDEEEEDDASLSYNAAY